MVTEKILDLEVIGERIKALRKKSGVYQADFAKMLGLGVRAYARWENGELILTNIRQLVQMAEYFNCSTDYLLGLTDNPERLYDKNNIKLD